MQDREGEYQILPFPFPTLGDGNDVVNGQILSRMTVPDSPLTLIQLEALIKKGGAHIQKLTPIKRF